MIFTQISSRADSPTPAIFLDRDGTINIDKGYLHKISEWQWQEGAIDSIRSLNQLGYKVIIISNQAGVARGLYSIDDVNSLHEYVNSELSKHGAIIDAFCFCTHHPEFSGKCDCRKPSPEMILHSAKAMNIDLEKSWMVGDKLIDVEAAKAANIKGILVRTGHGASEEKLSLTPITVMDNISSAVKLITGKLA